MFKIKKIPGITKIKITRAAAVILFLTVIPAFSSCQAPNEGPGNNPGTIVTTGSEDMTTTTEPGSSETGVSVSESGAGDEAIIKDFNKLLEEKARSDQLISFIDNNMSKTSPATMDYFLEKLEMVQRGDKQYYTDLLFEDDWQGKLNSTFHQDIYAKNLVDIQDMPLKEILTGIFKSGFKLIPLEGSFYPYIDYEFLKKYRDNLSPEYQDYLNVMAGESSKIFSRDAALTISWDELAFRLMNSEEFLLRYPPDTVRKKTVGDLYMNYLVSYLVGQNNTPSYDYGNKIVKPEVLESYEKLVSGYPGHITTGFIEAYQEILTETGNTVNDTVFKKIDGIYMQAIHAFSLDTPFLLLEAARNTYYQTSFSQNGYVVLINGEIREKIDSNTANDVVIKLSDLTAFGDFDGDGINDAAGILISSTQNGVIRYSVTLNLNRYFYLQNIPDFILGVDPEIKVQSLEIKKNQVIVTMSVKGLQKTVVLGVRDGQFFES